tara:strand:+ start:160378 stop:160641 length:264 start_codon:yes stop_codon:yes gene_type:complete
MKEFQLKFNNFTANLVTANDAIGSLRIVKNSEYFSINILINDINLQVYINILNNEENLELNSWINECIKPEYIKREETITKLLKEFE